MSTVFGYVHFSIGSQEIEAAKEQLAAAGATNIVVEPRPAPGGPPIVNVPQEFEPLRKQPALIDLLQSATSGDTLIVARLYHLAPAILRLVSAFENLNKSGIDLVSLDDELDTREPGGDRIFACISALDDLIEDFRERHHGVTIRIMEGNGGGGE
jgi:DNA invertase Pin-like site-specific DNA recombinase